MARRKKHPTYDSKETQTVLGLLLLVASLFFFISFFAVSNESSIFTQARSIFGQSTLMTSFFFLSLGLNRLGSTIPFARTSSLIGQGILVVLLPALMTSLSSGQFEIFRYAEDISKVPGGRVGYFIIVDLMKETFPIQPATSLILFLMTLIFIPVALTVPVSKLVEYTTKAFIWIREKGKNIDIQEDLQLSSQKTASTSKLEKASTFGDFNKLIKQKKVTSKTDKKKSEEDEMVRIPVLKPINVVSDNIEVILTEEQMDRKTLIQDSLNYPNWHFPPSSILLPYKKLSGKEPAIEQNAHIIEQTLGSFGVQARVEDFYTGPSIVQYALNIPLGVKVEKVAGLASNLALALGVDSHAVRIDTIPETTYLGIEIPRTNREMVRFRELMEAREMRNNDFFLPIPIGKDIDGSIVSADIQKMPHLLIAGATGSGKSVLTNSFVSSILMRRSPDELRLILVDPKQVEFSDYNGIPHLLTPVITNMNDVVDWLKYAVNVMENRYAILAKEQVRNIQSYNEKKGFSAMPYIVIVIDEMADMMMTGNKVETETQIVRLAQKARAVGIHLILATQRPSVNVITGIIKANIPGRIGMSVTSSTDSRVILDRIGAESLMGRGDLLYKAPDKTKASRLQGGNIEQSEVTEIVESIKSQAPEVGYLTLDDIREFTGGGISDGNMGMSGGVAQGSLFEQAVRIVVQHNKGSSSFLQRKLSIGFNKAADLVEELESAGVLGPQNSSKPRDVLISDAEAFLNEWKDQGGSSF
jgi:DNA segregation ATPase FtsK/SpoIIIE-like protein